VLIAFSRAPPAVRRDGGCAGVRYFRQITLWRVGAYIDLKRVPPLHGPRGASGIAQVAARAAVSSVPGFVRIHYFVWTVAACFPGPFEVVL
jgi:hypothetical protein